MHAYEVEDRGPICRDTTQVIVPSRPHMEGAVWRSIVESVRVGDGDELVLLPMEQQHRCFQFSQSPGAFEGIPDKNSG